MTTLAVMLIVLVVYAVRQSYAHPQRKWERSKRYAMTLNDWQRETYGDWSGHVDAYSTQARFMAQSPHATVLSGSRMHPGVQASLVEFANRSRVTFTDYGDGKHYTGLNEPIIGFMPGENMT